MTWQIQLPVRDRSDDLADVAIATSEIEDPEAREIARTIAIDAVVADGLRTAGELIDHLEAMTQPERREILNRARLANGLDTVADTEAHEAFVRANEALARRPRPPLPRCPVCGTPPLTAEGMPDPNIVPVKRWHCEAHRDQAAPGDLEPPPSGIGPDMRPIPDPDEVERERAKDERRAELDRKRREERKAEAEAIRIARERYHEQHRNDPYANPWNGPGWAGKT